MTDLKHNLFSFSMDNQIDDICEQKGRQSLTHYNSMVNLKDTITVNELDEHCDDIIEHSLSMMDDFNEIELNEFMDQNIT